MANSKLQMPANYMALNESEMSCVEGGRTISGISPLAPSRIIQARLSACNVRIAVG